MENEKLKIGITQGDTNGIGWEIILKLLSDSRFTELCTPIIYGSSKAAAHYRNLLKDLEPLQFNTIKSASEAKRMRVNLIETSSKDLHIEPGKSTPESGRAAVEALRVAVKELKQGSIDALVTAPISKEAVQSEEFQFTGHTEFLASELEGEPLMMMCSENLRVGLVTIHIPVSKISASINKERITERLRQLRTLLKQDFGIVEPRIAVLSLNPHAGDGGLLGDEESEIIKPAIVEAFQEGVLAYGPFAADGLFASGNYKNYDAVLAMYHDQGLAPFKTISPDGVNFTACLSAVRTSPDHGVAYDIAGKGLADPQSMRSAIYMAIDIVRNRKNWIEWNSNPLVHIEHEKRERPEREGFDARALKDEEHSSADSFHSKERKWHSPKPYKQEQREEPNNEPKNE